MADDPADWSRPRAAAGVLFFDVEGRILLVKPTYKEGWDIPGGYVNAGETPRQAAIREVKEELGLDVKLGDPLVIDWAPHPTDGDKVLFIFDGGELAPTDAGRIQLDEDELSEHQFFDLAEARLRLIDRLVRRVAAALDGRARASLVYLEPALATGTR